MIATGLLKTLSLAPKTILLGLPQILSYTKYSEKSDIQNRVVHIRVINSISLQSMSYN